MSARIRLSAPVVGFVSQPGAVARISFPWVDAGEPIAHQTPAGAEVVVLVWPTDAKGNVDAEGAKLHGPRVTTWVLSEAEIGELRRRLGQGWDFAKYDLLVSGGPAAPKLAPAWPSFRDSPYAPKLTAEQLEAMVAK